MIRTTCTCGKRLKADDKHQGKTIKCPRCGQPVTMPLSLDDIPSLVDTKALILPKPDRRSDRKR